MLVMHHLVEEVAVDSVVVVVDLQFGMSELHDTFVQCAREMHVLCMRENFDY